MRWVPKRANSYQMPRHSTKLSCANRENHAGDTAGPGALKMKIEKGWAERDSPGRIA
jgi:hypothetical protein